MGNSYLADIPGNFFVVKLGTASAQASGDANARSSALSMVAPAPLRILSVWKGNLAASEVTKGTATTSASYRRHTINNGGSLGTATTILASLNATSSAAASGSRGYAVDSTQTVAAGELIYASHLTVGAATADGTDAAACEMQLAYQLL